MVGNLKGLYVCDFETLNDESDCRVWGWAMCSLEANTITYGTNISEFINVIQQLDKARLFFHNLKFDGEFIVNHLLTIGFSVVSDNKMLEPNTLSCMISELGAWYDISIMFDSFNVVTIRDSLKKIPLKVKEIAQAFNMEIRKGSIDYDLHRPIEHELTDDEIGYLKNDVEIVSEALKVQYDEGLDGMTVSSDCLKDYTSTIGGKSSFRNLFPVLDDALHENIKLAYRGGYVYVKPSIAGKVVSAGSVYDYNSMYSGVMMGELLPYGFPIPFKGEYQPIPNHPLYIQHIRCDFTLKENHLPTVQIKGQPMFKSSEYLTTSEGFKPDLYLTNIEMKLLFEHYDIEPDIEYLGGYAFRGKRGLFDNYINKHSYTKTHSKGGVRLIAKLKLNSLYGKFGSSIDVTGKIPFLKSDGSLGLRKKSLRELSREDGTKFWYDDPNLRDYKDPVYMPIAVFITSYARNKIIRAGQDIYDRFCYCDTDSVHITGIDVPPSLEKHIHPTKLGYLKLENQFVRAKFLRPKTYIEEDCVVFVRDDNGVKLLDDDGNPIFKEVEYGEHETTHNNVKCAGLDDHSKPYVTFENFYIGSKIAVPEHAMKLRPKHVKGGIVLTKQEINIREMTFGKI